MHDLSCLMTLQLAAHTSNIISFMPSIISTCWRAWQLLSLVLLSPGAVAVPGHGRAHREGSLPCTAPGNAGHGQGPWAFSVRPGIGLSKILLSFPPFSPVSERALRLLLSVPGRTAFFQFLSLPYKIILTWMPTTKPLKATAAKLHSPSSSLVMISCVSMSSAAASQPKNHPGQDQAASFLIWRAPCSHSPCLTHCS